MPPRPRRRTAGIAAGAAAAAGLLGLVVVQGPTRPVAQLGAGESLRTSCTPADGSLSWKRSDKRSGVVSCSGTASSTTSTVPTTLPPSPTTAPAPTTTSSVPSSATCAPFPAFPDAGCTGWRHTGVTLSAYSGSTTITTAGAVIDSKVISGDLVIRASNVTVKRSLVRGRIDLGYGDVSGVLIEDVEVDAGNTTYSVISAAGFTCRRCDIHGGGQGINGYNFTVEDSYIHDLYGTGTVHSEAILGFNGGMVVRHNRLEGKYNAASGHFDPNDGGMSSAASFYTHGDFWGPIDGLVFERNLLSVGGGERDYAGYCLYGGGARTSNGVFKDNVFVRHPANPARCGYWGSVTDIPSGPGSVWSGNRYDDGAPL